MAKWTDVFRIGPTSMSGNGAVGKFWQSYKVCLRVGV